MSAIRALATADARDPQSTPVAGAAPVLPLADVSEDEAYDHFEEYEPPVRQRKHSALGGSLGGVNANMAQKRNGALKRVAALAKHGFGGR